MHHVLPKDPDVLLSRADLARILPVSRRTLDVWAQQDKGPPFMKVGPRRVAYRTGDVREWLRQQERRGGSLGGGDAAG